MQFLNADETPKDRVLHGRPAIAYKNMTLNGAQSLFRFPGPYRGLYRRQRRHLVPITEATLISA